MLSRKQQGYTLAMPVSRRTFLYSTAAVATWPLAAGARQARTETATGAFRHGVASGDPLTDRVILWTRVTPRDGSDTARPLDVRWQVATDDRLANVVSRGTAQAALERDFTVKVDATNLKPGATYYYAFDIAGEQSPIGRTRTLPDRGAQRIRLAQVSCSNYPTGYFNVYRCLANRPDLDAVLHLGDYIYEFASGRYSDPSLSRSVQPANELVSLRDYRNRYAFYRNDVDLQAVHRQHPFIVVWDDHESANDAWSGGAGNHNANQGDWKVRQRAAYRAYLEWMPIRESADAGIRLYRRFAFGGLADLLMLDTRGLRDQQVPTADRAGIANARRTLLGAQQEAWLAESLRASQGAGTHWRILGQQILFSPLTVPGMNVLRPDVWDGYPAARERIFNMLESGGITDVAVLTGDIHSSWALDIARDPWSAYDPKTAKGSVGVEIVTPAVSSPPMFSTPAQREIATMLQPLARHLKFLDGDSRGYVLLDISPKALIADWYFVPTVAERSERESRAVRFVCEHGSSRLVNE
jgi:alkaline phosphatase D